MLRELFISVASGLIVALVLGLFKRGGSRPAAWTGQTAGYNPPARRGSGLGGLIRLALAVGGGLAIAYATAPLLLGRRFGHYGRHYGRFDDYGGLASHIPMIVLTVLGTAIVWGVLAALMRR